MSLWDWGVWLASWLAPLGWLSAAVFFALWVVAPAIRMDPRTFAWATGTCAALAALSHLSILHHGRSSGRFTSEQAQELRRALWTRKGYGRWRALIGQAPTRYHGRSHSGERPRFD
jgi:hypothetical protein